METKVAALAFALLSQALYVMSHIAWETRGPLVSLLIFAGANANLIFAFVVWREGRTLEPARARRTSSQ